MPNRHESRGLLLKYIYQCSHKTVNEFISNDIDRFWNHNVKRNDLENHDYYKRIANGVLSLFPTIDKTIEAHLENWRMDRLHKIDLCVLRLALFEMFYDPEQKQIDRAIIIDEAVVLSKQYGDEDSSAFVNGVLDKISKKYEKDIPA